MKAEAIPPRQSHRHGHFRVGEKKESQIIDFIPLKDMDELTATLQDFLRSNERIEVLITDLDRKTISSRILELGGHFRRIIVREYDGVIYLCRAAYWHGKKLPIDLHYPTEEEMGELQVEDVDEIIHKVALQNPITLPST